MTLQAPNVDHNRARTSLGPAAVGEPWTQVWLRPMVSGTAGLVVLVAGYGLCLPHVGTSPSIFDSRSLSGSPPLVHAASEVAVERTVSPPPYHRARSSPALSFAEQAREVQAALSLNKSQLAQALGVSRPTLYDWLDGKEPNSANAQRLTTLLDLVTEAGLSGQRPLNARFLRLQSTGAFATVLEALTATNLDGPALIRMFRDARTLGDTADAERATREQRLRALGFESPSPEVRREQLARNLAMRDWPTG